MSQVHLDQARWRALLEQPDMALLEHLASGCEVCDAFLGEVPGLDGSVDAVLLSMVQRVPDEAAPHFEAVFHRALRPSGPSRRRLTVAFAAAAAVLLGIPLMHLSKANEVGKEQPTGVKGAEVAHLDLRAAIKSPTGLTPLSEQASVSGASALVFHVRSTVAGPARLFLQRPGQTPVELAQLGLSEGEQELEQGDQGGLLGVSLAGERGLVSIWLVASSSPISQESALEAIVTGGSPEVAVAKLKVDVGL